MKNHLAALLAIMLLASAGPLAQAANGMKAPASDDNNNAGTMAGPTNSDSAGSGNNADNTGLNKRDRNDHTMLPTDQSSSRADTEVTANIRRAIMADHSLSGYARNVKIITANGQVTLRGPVRNERERQKVLDKARRFAADNKLVDALEIAP